MALQTPRRLPPSARPSLTTSHLNTASSPNLALASSTAMARKASLQALTGVTSPDVGGADLQVGDLVDVPGGMHGTIKFIGSVRSRKGVFAGVELAEEYAVRGKNDGDVDGTHYFETTIPGAGIFLPLHRAAKRSSGSSLAPPTPSTPSYSFGASLNGGPNKFSPPTPSGNNKFSQSVGPGARAPSPTLKNKQRPSLPRPESPLRKGPALAPPSRGATASPAAFSKSTGPQRFVSSPAPARMGMGIQKPRTPGPRPYSRSSSRIGQHETIQEDNDTTPVGAQRSSQGSRSGYRPQSRVGSGATEEQVELLTKKLEERDRQLKEQAASLADMESSLTELQNLIPADGDMRNSGLPEDEDTSQLRALVREKNDKISMLTAEFDAHRADFRSTIDTLEMASTETARVYEEKINRLTQELNELQDRDEDVESVANQLKQLEELVQELEEGLEDARRGEAEARGEVEFLRGEVERGRSELRREREKAAAALKSAGSAVDGSVNDGSSRDIAQRDDEIRGLKAIIHSLSSGPDMSSARASPGLRNGATQDSEEFKQLQKRFEAIEREKEELRGLIERKNHREEELEREIQRLGQVQPNGTSALPGQINGVDNRDSVISNPLSDRTAIQDKHSSKGTQRSFTQTPRASQLDVPSTSLETMIESDGQSSVDGSVLWCEICETGGHDILNCTAMGSEASDSEKKDREAEPMIPGHTPRGLNLPTEKVPSPIKAVAPVTVTPKRATSSSGVAPTAPLPDPYSTSLVPGKGQTVADAGKWCALCERDGHDATICPFEDAF